MYNILSTLLIFILNSLHIIFLFSPIIIFFVNKKYVNYIFKYLFLVLILIPIHWDLFQNQCLLTLLTDKLGDLKKTEFNSEFSEKYLKWFYEPLMLLFGMEWNSDNLDFIIIIHWIVNLILIWYYCFYIYIK